MKVYIYYDKTKPEIDLIYNVLLKDVDLVKVEIEADNAEDAVTIFEKMVRNNEI